MKRWISFIVICLLLFGLLFVSACGENGVSKTGKANSGTANPPPINPEGSRNFPGPAPIDI